MGENVYNNIASTQHCSIVIITVIITTENFYIYIGIGSSILICVSQPCAFNEEKWKHYSANFSLFTVEWKKRKTNFRHDGRNENIFWWIMYMSRCDSNSLIQKSRQLSRFLKNTCRFEFIIANFSFELSNISTKFCICRLILRSPREKWRWFLNAHFSISFYKVEFWKPK